MNIVYFIDHLRPDGTQRVLTQLAQGLDERGHRQAVVCLNDSWNAEVVGALHAAGCDVRIIGKAALVTGKGFVSTWRWLKLQRFDVAVTMLFAADMIGRLLAHSAAVPRIVTSLRARNVNYSSWKRWMVRRTMPLADVIVLNSPSLWEFAVQEEGALPERLVVIPNGVQPGNYQRVIARDWLRREFDIPETGRVVGSAGRMTCQKGIDLLLDAAVHISDNRVHLLLVGDGEELPALRRRAGANGLNGSVHFTGYRRDLPRLLGTLDLYVQPSRFEGMPNALLEAMAAGCPVVATAVDGNRDLIEDGRSGWLAAPEDSWSIAECIIRALSDPQEAHRRGVAARERVCTLYDIDQMVGRWEIVLNENKN